MTRVVDKVEVTINGCDDITDDEIRLYIEETKKRYITNYKHQDLTELTLTFNGDDVSVDYTITNTGFERIRRITGLDKVAPQVAL